MKNVSPAKVNMTRMKKADILRILDEYDEYSRELEKQARRCSKRADYWRAAAVNSIIGWLLLALALAVSAGKCD